MRHGEKKLNIGGYKKKSKRRKKNIRITLSFTWGKNYFE
jgi:hypothetical protein